MKAIEKVGRLLKPPKEQIGIVTGEVIQVSPLKVRINEDIVAQTPKLYYASGIIFECGDKVIVQASKDNQRFYVLGKAVSA